MAQRMKRVKNRTRTHCAKCCHCLMIIREPTSIWGKSVVCKKIPESMRYGAGHYSGTIVPRYCSMFEDKKAETTFHFSGADN